MSQTFSTDRMDVNAKNSNKNFNEKILLKLNAYVEWNKIFYLRNTTQIT